jgi:hypothetical protein
MNPSEREIQRKLESVEDELTGEDEADRFDAPLMIILRDPPIDPLPEVPHGGIPVFPSLEAAEEEYGEDLWKEPTTKIWNALDQSEISENDS